MLSPKVPFCLLCSNFNLLKVIVDSLLFAGGLLIIVIDGPMTPLLPYVRSQLKVLSTVAGARRLQLQLILQTLNDSIEMLFEENEKRAFVKTCSGRETEQQRVSQKQNSHFDSRRAGRLPVPRCAARSVARLGGLQFRGPAYEYRSAALHQLRRCPACDGCLLRGNTM